MFFSRLFGFSQALQRLKARIILDTTCIFARFVLLIIELLCVFVKPLFGTVLLDLNVSFLVWQALFTAYGL